MDILAPEILSKEWDLMVDELRPAVFKIAAFTPDFCRRLADKANTACWSDNRHDIAPTYDVLLKDVDEQIYEQYIEVHREYIHSMAKYCLSFIPGAVVRDKYREETFIAKYTPDKQTHLMLHHDGDSVSYTINTLLSDNFTGGGTYFEGDRKFNGFLVKPKVGETLMHPGNRKYRHGSRPVTAGERLLLISFIQF